MGKKEVLPAHSQDLMTRLRNHMAVHRLSQRATAEALEVGESHLNRWLCGHVKPCGAWKRIIEAYLAGK